MGCVRVVQSDRQNGRIARELRHRGCGSTEQCVGRLPPRLTLVLGKKADSNAVSLWVGRGCSSLGRRMCQDMVIGTEEGRLCLRCRKRRLGLRLGEGGEGVRLREIPFRDVAQAGSIIWYGCGVVCCRCLGRRLKSRSGGANGANDVVGAGGGRMHNGR
jgi:hypothetical protein